MNTRKWPRRLLKSFLAFGILTALFIYTFFNTALFQYYRDLWVITAMSTSSHQYLATWFLSDEAINAILDSYEVVNTTDSDQSMIDVASSTDAITVDSLNENNYTGYVITISDPTRVSLISTTTANGSGTLLSTTAKTTDALIAMNAGGYSVRRSSGNGTLNSLTIIDQELLYGDSSEQYSMIGFTAAGVLMLGNYTYQQALDAGIEDAISFGPFLIVNGENQITNTSSGGLQPRTAIGQTADGMIILVVIEGRSTSSLGATYYNLQEIMTRYGAVNAANLDGGGSSEIIYNQTRLNELSNNQERLLPTAIVVY